MTDLPTGWEWAQLIDLVDVLDNMRIPVSASERANRLGSVPYYGATGPVGWIDSALFNEDLVLLGEDGVQFFDPTKPKAYAISGPAWVNNHAHVLRSTDTNIDQRYLLHYLNHFDYHGYAIGTTRLKLTKAAMGSIPVPVPPAEEQRRIVAALEDHLSRLDAGMSALRTALARAHILREQVIAAGCTGFLSSLDEGNAPAPSDVGLQDHPLPSIPGRWTWVRLHEVADVVGGITKDAKKQGDPSYEEVPYLRVANVQRGHLDLSNITTIRASREKIQQLTLENGDVLLNEGGDRDKLARGWIWEGQIDNCIHQNHVFRARIRDDALHPKLLAWHANTFGKRWAEANGKQSVNLASISLSKIKLLPVPIPPRDDQQRIVAAIDEQVTAADRQADAARQSLRRAEVLRRALLAEAFGGRLVGQDPRDEPASVLLGRIRAERAARPKVTRGRRSRAAEPGQGSLL